MLRECHGLVWDSELDLPELQPAGPTATVDVEVRLGQIPAVPDGAVRRSPRLSGTDTDLWLSIDDVADFWVHAGCQITVAPAQSSHPDEVRLYLLGSALGALLMQRGLLVLHGNAIAFGEEVVVAVGQSGAGKSTLAGEFRRRGFEVFSDDVVAIDAELRTEAGPARIKLWRDAAMGLGVDVSQLARVRPQDDKYYVPLVTQPRDRLVVSAVYVLTTHEGPELSLEPLSGGARLSALVPHTYRRGFLVTPQQQSRHLSLCGALASAAHVSVVNRPPDRGTPAATADAIIADFTDR